MRKYVKHLMVCLEQGKCAQFVLWVSPSPDKLAFPSNHTFQTSQPNAYVSPYFIFVIIFSYTISNFWAISSNIRASNSLLCQWFLKICSRTKYFIIFFFFPGQLNGFSSGIPNPSVSIKWCLIFLDFPSIQWDTNIINHTH